MKTAYTPSLIVENDLSYSIPLYQRLFEWNTENIEILLDDLYRAFKSNPDEDYYIGLLTATSGGDLVDGQQRFTVLTLLGCILKDEKYDSRWSLFLNPDSPRLKFQSRPQDAIYLKQIMNDGIDNFIGTYVNPKMQNALDTISKTMAGIDDAEKHPFASFMYDHISFFISELPSKYSPRDLNKYFERMNSTGKNLEQHEILKVKLLRNLDGDITPLLKLWNKIAEVDTELLRIRRHRNETEPEFIQRRIAILNSDLSTIIRNGYINGISRNPSSDEMSSVSIRQIQLSEVSPKKEGMVVRNSKSLLSFPIILLLTLYWKIKEEAKTTITSLRDFFNPANLLETFERYLPYQGPEMDKSEISDFMSRLLKARLVLDYCFVRSSEYGYSLEMASEESESGKSLIMLESMLFVSSNRYSYYKWFTVLMESIKTEFPKETDLFETLKSHDDESNPLEEYGKLTYGADIRYWFWRLDFYIWSNRFHLFKDNPEALQVAEKYRFVRNRSIEHVAPQHPLQNSSLQWEDTDTDDKLRDSFGNLAMISNGLNSALKNQPYEVKKAHVQAYVNGSMTGTIESLSLLLINTLYDRWDKERIKEYGQMAYNMLAKSYKNIE